MNRYVMMIAGAAMGLLSVGAVQASDMATIAAATFKLYDGERGMCSTTFLRNDKDGAFFLTAAHCVDGDGQYNVRRQTLTGVDDKEPLTVLSEQIIYVKAVKTISKKDITLLQVKDKSITFAEAPVDIATAKEAADKLKVGDNLLAAGYPAAEAFAIIKGEYTGVIPTPFAGLEGVMYQTTVPVAGGNSGGALYADFDGEWKLVGTTTGKRVDNDVMTYFQTAKTVEDVLRGFVTTGSRDAPVVKETNPGSGIDSK